MINPFSRWIEREQKHTITMYVGLPGYYFQLTNWLTLLLNLLGPKAWTNHQLFLPPAKKNGAVSGWWSPSVGRKDLQKKTGSSSRDLVKGSISDLWKGLKTWPPFGKSIKVTNWRSREHRNPRGERTKFMQVPFPKTTSSTEKTGGTVCTLFWAILQVGFPFHKP